jgi:hypothetical protein
MRSYRFLALAALVLAGHTSSVGAQTTPAAAPDDAPSIRVGTTIFADYTVTLEPKGTDVDGNSFTPNAFNIARAYINVAGQINHVVRFRVTPDIRRQTGSGSSLDGSLTFRLKYAYMQFNLDDWLGSDTYARFGMQPTPWVGFIDEIYRYRFQGPTLEDREGILSSSDVGATIRYNFKGDYGDVHGGFYNGDGYDAADPNDQKALMVRATIRPLPGHPLLRGLRVSGFYDHDAYVQDAERRRGIVGATYEHPYFNVGGNYLTASDQTQMTTSKLDSTGYTVWATPKTPKGHGWEGLLRFDRLTEEQAGAATRGERNRTVAGIAYWFPHKGNVAAAVLLDYEHVDNDAYAPARSDERRWAIHTLINF